jgi:hypothetical protein
MVPARHHHGSGGRWRPRPHGAGQGGAGPDELALAGLEIDEVHAHVGVGGVARRSVEVHEHPPVGSGAEGDRRGCAQSVLGEDRSDHAIHDPHRFMSVAGLVVQPDDSVRPRSDGAGRLAADPRPHVDRVVVGQRHDLGPVRADERSQLVADRAGRHPAPREQLADLTGEAVIGAIRASRLALGPGQHPHVARDPPSRRFRHLDLGAPQEAVGTAHQPPVREWQARRRVPGGRGSRRIPPVEIAVLADRQAACEHVGLETGQLGQIREAEPTPPPLAPVELHEHHRIVLLYRESERALRGDRLER